MDDSPTVILWTQSTRVLDGWLEKSRPDLILRCREKRTTAYVTLDMQPDPDGIDATRGRLRYDDEPPQPMEFGVGTEGESIFLPGAIPQIRGMLKSNRLRIELVPFNASPSVIEFNLDGLSEVITPLHEICGWTVEPPPPPPPSRRERLFSLFESSRFFKLVRLELDSEGGNWRRYRSQRAGLVTFTVFEGDPVEIDLYGGLVIITLDDQAALDELVSDLRASDPLSQNSAAIVDARGKVFKVISEEPFFEKYDFKLHGDSSGEGQRHYYGPNLEHMTVRVTRDGLECERFVRSRNKGRVAVRCKRLAFTTV